MDLRYDWTVGEVLDLLGSPLVELLWQSQSVHRQANPHYTVQLASLLSVKTGGCSENCSYCSQSAHHPQALTTPAPMLNLEQVLEKAAAAKAAGAHRFCMGWAWREIRNGQPFEAMLSMVRGVHAMGLETCITAGMLTDHQAQQLAAAGLTAYNHNLDTGPGHYHKVVTTRTYKDRLSTLKRVRQAGITLCCGGILGLGETMEDRAELLVILAGMEPHPESVPINTLVPIPGTPLEKQPAVDPLELVRMVATARILMPHSRIRLSAGRTSLSREAQVLCLLAGADSMFYGDRLLTTPNPELSNDQELLQAAGVRWRQESQSPETVPPSPNQQ